MIVQIALLSCKNASPVIAGLSHYIAALTAVQKFEAVKIFSSTPAVEKSFAVFGVIAIAAMTVMFVFVTALKRSCEKIRQRAVFSDLAQRAGLSGDEQKLLASLARTAKTKRVELLFTDAALFDRCVSKLVEKAVRRKKNEERLKTLKLELAFLKEKLGFRRRLGIATIQSSPSRMSGSRLIAAGKAVELINSKNNSDIIDATVVENSELSITVKVKNSVNISSGQRWLVRYYRGANICEFDTVCVSSRDNMISFNHSEKVRVVNRRQFIRVAIRKQAFIAPFGFTRDIGLGVDLPEFRPAVLTEIGGPGVRLESDLPVSIGQRVLVVFELEQSGKSKYERFGTEFAHSKKRLIQDVAVVRNIGRDNERQSIAVELVGLSDNELDSLIQATNAELIRNVKSKKLSKNSETERLAGSFVLS
ncbi:MAG: hypothetical protein PHP01_00920 [Phycisphaerae bacterium]|nr:hypothetical protein [Phycisphaerae bacterium]